MGRRSRAILACRVEPCEAYIRCGGSSGGRNGGRKAYAFINIDEMALKGSIYSRVS